jgi:hypothetical protein
VPAIAQGGDFVVGHRVLVAKPRVTDIKFVGNQHVLSRRLKGEMETKKWWMFSWLTGSGKLKDEEFDEDKDRLADFYRNGGYIDFELKDVQFDQIAPAKMIVRFIISEGKRYRVGQVSVKGNKLFSTEEIRHGVHGGAVETSIMLARYPRTVRQEAIADFRPASIAMEKKFRWLSAHRPVPFAWQAQDLHESGAVGDATNASAEKGEQLLDHGARAFCELLDDVDKFDPELFRRRPKN